MYPGKFIKGVKNGDGKYFSIFYEVPYTKHIDSYYDENTDSKFNKERNTYSKAILVWYNTGLQSQPEEGNQVYDYFIEVEVESGDTSTQVADKTSVILSNIIETDVNGNEIKLFGCIILIT